MKYIFIYIEIIYITFKIINQKYTSFKTSYIKVALSIKIWIGQLNTCHCSYKKLQYAIVKLFFKIQTLFF